MTRKKKTLRVDFHRDGGSFVCFSAPPYCPSLCATGLRKFVDLPRAVRNITVVITTVRPKGDNFHILKKARYGHDNWDLVGLEPGVGQPGFMLSFSDFLKAEFGSGYIYAWVEA